MKKVLLVYAPFCTPASPPYSITQLYSFLKGNCKVDVSVLDLNLEFHNLKFSEYQQYYHNSTKWQEYNKITTEYRNVTSKVYSDNNTLIVKGEKPELFEELVQKIKDQKPDIVAFSIVYSSQAFYAYSLIKELTKFDITTVIGGPAINDKLMSVADTTLQNELELLNYLKGKDVNHDEINFNTVPDFSIYNVKDYYTPQPVIPIRTSSTCYYKQCTFCSHFSTVPYHEFSLDVIKKTIINSNQKKFFIIDDMIPSKRLLDIAAILKPLGVQWTCQLKPTADFDHKTLKTLHESGLTMIIWGVESGSDRVLQVMKKGTIKKYVETVLKNSHNVGIKNVVYIMFGFPTETENEFIETIDFLEKNKMNIDLISTSIFGLQKGTYIYTNPEEFGITKIIEEERTVLDPRIRYETSIGLSQKEVRSFVKKYKHTIDTINKYPRMMNYFREHMLCL
ncbi:radical SAM protein [Candidatus Woesearchaeota archaeon]|jgi:radical SAM superfamily enzyme YgiQ (UPF0313 family)|nr:radical SAM protein [Candidatus Woesearchaeota archaeon]MBT5396885.1 radical SAM protein [Candidatus Woesearchaeota archaeon]MBT5924967.1 radical SAM protein [Candidatus Woesearchaeota archaeon]MBT6367078.1 radical SAM protein [Candidatus Woesearchaeota archaeon]MBT7762348.1 radical SAM protein [Candidatus Woesearchaeota archaeon]